MALFDLTTPAAVSAWMGNSTSDNAAQLVPLISACSRAILSSLDRPRILPQTYTELYDVDPSTRRVTLRNFPVVSVAANGVQLGPAIIQPMNPLTGQPIAYPPNLGYGMGYGYALEPDRWGGAPPGESQDILLMGVVPYRRDEGLQVIYTAGYQTTDAYTVAAPYQIKALQPYGLWAIDSGVVYTNTGLALTLVNASPGLGQYSVNNGTYFFAAADAGAALSISYGFVPSDLAQACNEFVAQRLVAAGRVGVKSKSLAGQETISYDTSNMPAAVADMIRPYRRIHFG